MLALILYAGSFLSGAAAKEPDRGGSFDRVAAGNNEFAFDIYQRLAVPGKNLFISPLSMTTAFSMVYAGSRGVTRKEIEKVFRFKVTGDEMNSTWGGMLADMADRAKIGNYRLDSANRIWIDKRFSLEDAFTDAMKKYYDAGSKQLDFAGNPEESRSTINTWVAKNTNDKITGLVPDGAVTKATTLVLTNAVYFLGNWEYPFNDKSTERADFFVTPAQKTAVSMMKNFGHFGYFENQELQALSLPYKTRGKSNDALAMVIVLPKGRAGLAGLEKKLSCDNWKKWTDGLESSEVYVHLPRFEVTSFAVLAETLRQMGMKNALSPQADYSGIAPNICINEAFHKAYVKVNEKGTEAAAATAIIMVKANGGKKYTFRADHPFLFAIRDTKTNAILFIGRVIDPSR